MLDLKDAFDKMGFKAVKTNLETGNVVFDSDKNISEIIKKEGPVLYKYWKKYSTLK